MRKIAVQAPSNIALIKYWGKQDPNLQWPASDSLSMTLKNAFTRTVVTASENECDQVFIKGRPVSNFKKALEHLKFLRDETGFRGFLSIDSENSFPTGCGIASSASGLAALTLGAIGYWSNARSFDELARKGFTREVLADLSRYGSGSAARSLHGGFVKWEKGEAPNAQKISQRHASTHWGLSDIIVLISSEEKKVSSSEAHLAAWESPLFRPRLAGIPEKMKRLEQALEERSMDLLGPIIEEEALEMHSVMMTAEPATRFWTRGTERFISWLRIVRVGDGLPAWFTIDAGPNVHVICETIYRELVIERIKSEFPQYELLVDEVGEGPTMVSG